MERCSILEVYNPKKDLVWVNMDLFIISEAIDFIKEIGLEEMKRFRGHSCS